MSLFHSSKIWFLICRLDIYMVYVLVPCLHLNVRRRIKSTQTGKRKGAFIFGFAPKAVVFIRDLQCLIIQAIRSFWWWWNLTISSCKLCLLCVALRCVAVPSLCCGYAERTKQGPTQTISTSFCFLQFMEECVDVLVSWCWCVSCASQSVKV
jgi:hypothetical protein